MILSHRSIFRALVSVLIGASCLAPCAVAQAQNCHVGAYRLDDARIVDIGLSGDDGLRWRDLNGDTGRLVAEGGAWRSTYGWTDRPERLRVRFGDCAEGRIDFGRTRGRQLRLDTRETKFSSHGVSLSGRLVLPEGDAPVPIIVLLQGAERHSARDYDALQRILPSLGVGAFVYDKRGTGQSGGEYTQDFWLLADDASAAFREVRRMAGSRASRVGYLGPSQGGWVAPLAASHSSPDFVIVSFGLAVSVIDEDIEAIQLEMRLKGHGEEEIAHALEIARAAHVVFESGFSDGVEAFDAVRTRYRSASWYPDVRGNFTHFILGLSVDEIRAAGASFRFGTPWRYDPRAAIAAVDAPQLWVLGGQDLDAPSGATAERLAAMAGGGRPITVALYPQAEHGMTEFEIASDGSRQSTRYARGYFRLLADFARTGRVEGHYGDARITSN